MHLLLQFRNLYLFLPTLTISKISRNVPREWFLGNAALARSVRLSRFLQSTNFKKYLEWSGKKVSYEGCTHLQSDKQNSSKTLVTSNLK